MKNFKHVIFSLLALVLFTGCQDDDIEFGDITAPNNLVVTVELQGQDAENPNGDGSGIATLRASADNAISYQYIFNGATSSAPIGEGVFSFSSLGLNIYDVTAIAFGTGGASTATTIQVEVLSLYEPPADLITMLTGDDSKSWRIKSEANSHFGLGAIGGGLNGFFGAPPEDKAGVGMYDDRYIFNIDGTFTHITDNTNDDPDLDPNGTVFGREVLIDELGGVGAGVANGADIENYPYSDYTAQWFLTGPGGVETINLTGIGFLGYYIGGDHKYQIDMRSANEMTVRSTDGNGDFDWGFILIADE
jgi:hypothetical protein